MTGQFLVDTYTAISKSKKVLNEVHKRITTVNLDVEELEELIEVASVNDILVVKLTVKGDSPQLFVEIANTVTTIVQEQSTEYYGLEDIEVFDTANVLTNPTGPNRLLFVLDGILFGGAISKV